MATSPRTPPSSTYPFFGLGLHFGLLQSSLFFIVQVFISATYLGYFAVVLAWMVGILLGMRLPRWRRTEPMLLVSIVAYYAAIMATGVIVPMSGPALLYALFFMIVALPAGVFFVDFGGVASSRSLFLHENNGFILGLLLGMFGFLKWGVDFLYVAPLISVACALVSLRGRGLSGMLMLGIGVVASAKMGATRVQWALLLAMALGAVSLAIPPGVVVAEQDQAGAKQAGRSWVPRLMLFIAGFNLILLQYFISREFSTILAASELTILIIGVSYFVGYSVGYGVSELLTPTVLKIGALLMLPLHLCILLFSRVVAGHLINEGFGVLALLLLLMLASFGTSTLYAIFLPRLIAEVGDLSMVEGYSIDLAGAILGTLTMVGITMYAPAALWPTYFGLMVLMLLLLFRDSVALPLVGVVGASVLIGILALQSSVLPMVVSDYYRARGYDWPKVVVSANSFYHSMDVIDAFASAEQLRPKRRYAFINGVRYFSFVYDKDGSFAKQTKLSEYTYFLAEAPAHHLYELRERPLKILVMGAGSMYSIKRVSPYASTVTLVEIDPLVVKTAREAWQQVNEVDSIDNVEIIFDDAVHYLNTTDQRFDLIVNDISAPYYLGTMLLHGRDFYQLASTRLVAGGVFVDATQGRPRERSYRSNQMKILRGLADVFPHWRMLETSKDKGRQGNQGYVWASMSTDLRTEQISDTLESDHRRRGVTIYWEGSSHFRLHKTEPFSLHNMETLLSQNVSRTKRRLGAGRDEPPSLWHAWVRMRDVSDSGHSELVVRMLAALGRWWWALVGVMLLGAVPTGYLGWRRQGSRR